MVCDLPRIRSLAARSYEEAIIMTEIIRISVAGMVMMGCIANVLMKTEYRWEVNWLHSQQADRRR